MITDEDKERVRQQTDFVSLVSETVMLKRRGSEFWGCCPFHHEKSPSFKLNPSTGLWHCFGCGEGGDVFNYVMRREGLEFPDAIRYLADRAGIELVEERGAAGKGPRRNRLVECLAEAQSFYSMMLLRGRGDGPQSGRAYLGGRGFGSAVCKRWNLGFAPGRGQLVSHLSQKGFTRAEMLACDLAVDRGGRLQDRFYDRVMFPIHDEAGRCIAFGGRVLTDAKPKYLNTKETPVFHKSKHMFAFDYAKETIAARGVAVVCEGYTDVISMHEAGYSNAVAALGTSFSADHVKTLSRFAKTIVCMFDGDAAGQKAAERAVQYLADTEADLRCVVLPDNMDPAEFLAAKGSDAMQPQLDASRPLIDFVFEKRLSAYDLSVPGQRIRALDDMAGLLAPLKNSVLLDGYATRLADSLGTDVGETRRRIREAPIRHAEPDASDRDGMRAAVGSAAPAPRDDEPPIEGYGDVAVEPFYDASVAGQGISDFVLRQPDDALLSIDERRQSTVERELLALMAQNPDSVRGSDDRIGSFSWSDARHEAIAWAILATEPGCAPRVAVEAAESVVPDAPMILSGGRLASQDSVDLSKKVRFLLDQVELFSCKRTVRQIKARLQGSLSPQEAEGLFCEATELQRRINELSRSILQEVATSQ